MGTILDRYVLKSYLYAYFLCLMSFLFLFTAFDFFDRIEDFLKSEEPKLFRVIRHYYGSYYLILLKELNPAITLLAGLLTLSALERANELVLLRAAGISLRRSLRPLLIGAGITLAIALFNQEVLLPKWGTRIGLNMEKIKQTKKKGKKNLTPTTIFNPARNTYIYMKEFDLLTNSIHELKISARDEETGTETWFAKADRAVYIPDDPIDQTPASWTLQENVEIGDGPLERRVFEYPDTHHYSGDFLTPEEILRASIQGLDFVWLTELRKRISEEPEKVKLKTKLYQRITMPVATFCLFLLGIPFGLLGRGWGMFLTGFLALGICGSFYATSFMCEKFAMDRTIPPELGAWGPILLFAPVAFFLFRMVRT